jgi:hypothetical protein
LPVLAAPFSIKERKEFMRKNVIPGVCFAFLVFMATIHAETNDSSAVNIFNTKFSGYTYIEAGEVVKGFGYQEEYNHRWLSDACVGIFATTPIDKHLKVLMGLEGQLTYSFNAYHEQNVSFVPLRYPINKFWVSKGEGIYTFGDTSLTSLQIEAGYFWYKYNNEVRNLGEYLFRTYCYPTVFLNQFDRTFTELMGFRVGNTFGGIFHQDLILNSETKQYPFYDFSLSYLFDVCNPSFGGVRKFITFGGGVQFYRLIPVRGDLTYKHDIYNSINAYVDSTTHDSVWIGFPGTKVMGRVTFDIKGILPEKVANFFGAEDLKLYSEAAVLGVKSYDRYYSNWINRAPITVGINWPGFKFLDVINTEFEYLYSPYMNSTYGPIWQMVPVPTTDLTTPHEYLKFSVYAKKNIGKRMSLMAQVANDHLIPQSAYPDPSIQDYHDVTLKHGDWWWNFRARFDF